MTAACGPGALRVLLACATAAGIAGCAAPAGAPSLAVSKPASSLLPGGMTPQATQDAIAIGRSTQAEVAAALGPATVVRFDSGYEVWVYQTKSTDARREPSELVILFAPSGVAKKMRFRAGGDLKRR